MLPESIRERENESSEVILTPEDRARLDDLFAEIGHGNTLYLDVANDNSIIELRQKLRNEGSKAAVYLLEKMADPDTPDHVFDQRRDSQYSLYSCSELLSFCATSNEAKKIGEMLLHDRIALDSDRSCKGKLLDILMRVGNPDNIDQIVAYSGKSFGNRYDRSDELISSDNQDALKVLLALSERTDDEDVKNRIRLAKDKINENLRSHDLEPISEERTARILSYTDLSPQYLSDQFERLFRVRNFERPEYTSPQARLQWPEERDDDEIRLDYSEGKIDSLESRLETVKRLRHEAKKEKNIKETPEDDDAKFLRRHFLEYREENPSPYAPTLGIEIEIREQSLNLEKNEEGRYDTTEIRKKFLKTTKLGVPHGLDKFWEFSHKPVRYYHTLSREVQALIEMALINKEYKKHALHLTIGGVTTKSNGGEGVFCLARALEATGWSTTGGRLMRPYLVKQMVWNVKGKGGVRERFTEELQLNVDKGIEIRTLQLQGLAGLDRTLRSAFLLGAALKARQEELRGNKGLSEEQKQLASLWAQFETDTEKIFHKYNLPAPYLAWKAPGRSADGEKSEFIPFAKLLDEAKTNPESNGGKFVSEMRQLIIETRAKVAKIIYPKNDKEDKK